MRDSEDDFFEAADHFATCFNQSQSLVKSYRVMSVFFNFIEVEVTWLDELAEGLRNVVTSSHKYRNMVD